MTMMTDRNPEGRDTVEGFVDAVEDKSVKEMLGDLIDEIKRLRLALVLQESAHDLGDINDLVDLYFAG